MCQLHADTAVTKKKICTSGKRAVLMLLACKFGCSTCTSVITKRQYFIAAELVYI